MKMFDEDGLPIDGYDYRKHMVKDGLLIQETPYWVNENLYENLNKEIIHDRNIIEEEYMSCKSMGSKRSRKSKISKKSKNI